MRLSDSVRLEVLVRVPHGEELAFALCKPAHHGALVGLFEVHRELFPGLAGLAVDFLQDLRFQTSLVIDPVIGDPQEI